MTAMSTTATYEPLSSASMEDQSLEYRAVHTGAIASVVLGVLSVFVLVVGMTSDLGACLMVTPIPVVAMFFSMRSLAQISRQSDLYTGKKLALAGLTLAAFFLVTGVGYAGYVHVTEVPDGYTRISYSMMKPDELDERGGQPIPEDIAALDGQQVFIKGFIRPDSLKVRKNAKGFLLVRDNDTCCFGDLSKVKYYDQILVAMQGGLSVDYSTRVFRMGGTLRVHPENLAFGPGSAVYTLEVDYAE
jgi:hypothetical protein